MARPLAILALFLVLFSFSGRLSSQPLVPVYENDSIHFFTLEFLSAEEGYIGCISSSWEDYFIYTDDGGVTWDFNRAVALPRCIQMLSEDFGYAGGQDGAFWRLETPPNEWKYLSHISMPIDIYTVHFFDSLYGYVDYARTIDGAANWEMTGYDMVDYHFFNEYEAVATDRMRIFKSYDGATTWETKAELSPGHPASFRDIHFADDDFGIACGGWVIGRTLDGGETWSLNTSLPFGGYEVSRVVSFGPDLLFAVAQDYEQYGLLLQSTDRGTSWQVVDFTGELQDCQKVNDTLAYVIGVNGILYALDITDAPFEEITPRLIESEHVFEHDRNSGIFNDLFAMDHKNNDLFYSSATMFDSVVFMDTVLQDLNGNTGYTSAVSSDGQRLWTTTYRADWLFARGLLFDEDMIFCTGWYNGNLEIGDSSYHSANDNTYLIAYSPDGELLWSNVSGIPSAVIPGSMEVDNNGDIFLSARIESQPGLKDDPAHTLGLFHYSRETGELLSMQEVLGFSDFDPWYYERKYPFRFGENGDVYMAGTFYDSLTIGEQTFYSMGNPDFVVLKMDTQGSPDWILLGAGTGKDDLTDVELVSDGIIIGGTSSSYILNFGDEEIEIDSTEQMFVSKITPEGQVQWFEHSTGNKHEVSLSLIDLLTNSDGTTWGLGTFYGQVKFGEDSLIAVSPKDYYLIKAGQEGGLSAFGQVPNTWHQPLGTLPGTDSSLYVAGNTGSFGIFPNDTIGGNKIYVRKIKTEFVSIPEIVRHDQNVLEIYPNPGNGSFTIRDVTSKYCVLDIYDLKSRKVFSRRYQNPGPEQNVRASHLHPGIYLLRIVDEKEVRTGKVVVY